MRHVTYECGTSHVNESCPIRVRRVRYECVMWRSHVTCTQNKAPRPVDSGRNGRTRRPLLLSTRALQSVAVCCSVLQCDAVWCRVLQCVAISTRLRDLGRGRHTRQPLLLSPRTCACMIAQKYNTAGGMVYDGG